MHENLLSAINAFKRAREIIPDEPKSQALIKDILKAYESLCRIEGIHRTKKLEYFNSMIEEASEALKKGIG
jgi:hypothetical protein